MDTVLNTVVMTVKPFVMVAGSWLGRGHNLARDTMANVMATVEAIVIMTAKALAAVVNVVAAISLYSSFVR
jgi:hypothetical protein